MDKRKFTINNLQLTFEKYPAYKNSGVEWIGEIPDGWEVKRLKHVAAINNGLDYKKVESDTGFPVFGSGGPFAIASEFLFDGEAVLLGRKGTIDKPIYFNGKFWTVDTMFYTVCNYTVSTKFIYYLCTNIPFNYYSTSTALPSMTQSDLLNHYFCIPSFLQQTAIANFLYEKCEKIDRAVAQKEKMVELLKERKQIVIQNAVTKGLNPNAKMKDSGVEWIGEIPEGWEVVRNFQLFEEINEAGNENLPILSVSIHTAVSSGELDGDENIRGKIRIEDKSLYKLVEENDIVYNMMRAWQGAIGSVSINGMVSPAYVVAKPKGSLFTKFFEFQYRTKIFIQQMDRFSKGITDFRKRLYWDQFKDLITILPTPTEQYKIVTHIEKESTKIDKAISLQQKQIEKLKEYKATLINSAVTGKIKVNGVKT